MDELEINIVCASLNFRKLDAKSLAELKSAAIKQDRETIETLKSRMGFPVEQLAIIKKCNSVIIVVVHSWKADPQEVKNRILNAWDKTSEGGIANALQHIKVFNGIKAIKYLSESAMGLHSVVTGDTQVYAQIREPLIKAQETQHTIKVFEIIANWLQKVLKEVDSKTELHTGNVSIERLACDEISNLCNEREKVAIVGLGRSGSLIAKILSVDKKIPIIVTDRSEERAKAIAEKYKAKIAKFGDYSFVSNSKAIIIALSAIPETAAYVSGLLNAVKHDGGQNKLLIDLSSPPLINKKENIRPSIKLLDITDFSNEKQQIIEKRNNEANKARDIIDKLLPTVIKEINETISIARLEKQKKEGLCRLNQNKLKIIKVRDTALTAIRELLHNLGFMEIQTPYIVGVSTDPPKVDKGGVFGVTWPGGEAFLRQSNQLYKQIITISGAPKIFEIGPFWRAEAKETIRHLVETIGLDVEVRDLKSLEPLYKIAYKIIVATRAAISKLPDIQLPKLAIPSENKIPILEYSEAVNILNENGIDISFGEDLGLEREARLGEIIKSEFDSDLVIVQHYPTTVKKFYTLEIENNLTETFDMIFCGWELVSGALRETNVDNIKRRMRLSGVNPEQYSFYLSLLEGAPPHGGFGMGFDRLIAKIMKLNDIRDAVLFPRTFKTLIP
jgi:glutamyl-tRNA reductase